MTLETNEMHKLADEFYQKTLSRITLALRNSIVKIWRSWLRAVIK
jgi:hypothetical protein